MSEQGQDQASLARARLDLLYLQDHGALAGVAEIIRERRRQIEELGYTPEHDDRLGPRSHPSLVGMAGDKISMGYGLDAVVNQITPGDQAAYCAKAGALLAAEADRLHRVVNP